MKIGIISDTHGIVNAWEKAMKVFNGADVIIHGGDVLYHPPKLGFTSGYDIPAFSDMINSCSIPVLIARGNCDADVYDELIHVPILFPCAYTQLNGLRIMAIHGHTLRNGDIDLLAEKGHVDILITGHTHIPLIEKHDSMLHINPGSPSHSKWENNGRTTQTIGLIEDGRISIVDLNSGSELIGANIKL